MGRRVTRQWSGILIKLDAILGVRMHVWVIHSLDRQAVNGGWVLPHVPGIVPVDVCYLHMLFVCQVPFSLSGVGGDQPPHYLALAVSYLLSTDMETVCLVFIFYVMM
jgi:hypothetical protein